MKGFFTQLKNFRQRWVSARVLGMFKQMLPPMSETEQQAIAAGDVSFEKEIFQGSPNWPEFFKIPQLNLSPEEQCFLDHQVETLCLMLNDWEIEEVDLETWYELDIKPIPEPEDMSGPFELTREDLGYTDDTIHPEDWSGPLSEIEPDEYFH